jgi:hypothetical protein
VVQVMVTAEWVPLELAGSAVMVPVAPVNVPVPPVTVPRAYAPLLLLRAGLDEDEGVAVPIEACWAPGGDQGGHHLCWSRYFSWK